MGDDLGDDPHASTTINVARKHILDSGLSAFENFDIRRKFRVIFTDEFGNKELGEDAGGLFKEFLNLTIKESLETLFEKTSENEVILKANSDFLHLAEFVGKLIGKAIMDKILLNAKFNVVMLSQLIGMSMEF